MKTCRRGKSNGQCGESGVSLIQLLIAVAILGILAAVAIPSYEKQIQKARRSDAREALSEIAAQQLEFLLNNASYASSLAAMGYGNDSENGFYVLSLSAVGSTSFTLDALATGSQAKDLDCSVFRITQTGAKTAKTSTNADSTTSCW